MNSLNKTKLKKYAVYVLILLAAHLLQNLLPVFPMLFGVRPILLISAAVCISMYEGEIIGVTLPEKVEYVVTETTEAVKGNTTNNAQKDATLENGYVVKVPLFINQGETIIVSTLDGKYSSRA